jgi:hypothetical protein
MCEIRYVNISWDYIRNTYNKYIMCYVSNCNSGVDSGNWMYSENWTWAQTEFVLT